MAYDDDDYGNDRFDGGYRHGASSHSGGHNDFGKTSDFSTMISEDGKLLGVKLSPEMQQRLGEFYPALKTWLTRVGADFVEKKAGYTAGNIAGFGIAFSDQLIRFGHHLYESTKALNDLRIAVHPLTRSGSKKSAVAPLSGSNEVVANARARISGILGQRMVNTSAGIINAVPALYTMYERVNKDNHQRLRNNKIREAAGDPEKIADLYAQELAGGGSAVKHGFSVDDMRRGKEIYIEKHRVAYKAKFEAFRKANEKDIRKTLQAELDKLNAKNWEFHLPELKKRYGFDTGRLHDEINYIRRGDSRYLAEKDRHNAKKQNEVIDKLIKDFRKKNVDNLDHVTQNAVKGRFVRQEGAFDEEDRIHSYDSRHSWDHEDRNQPSTIKQQLEEKINRIEEERRKYEQEKSSPRHEGDGKLPPVLRDLGLGWLAGFSTEFLTNLFGGKALEKYQQPIALDYILHLRRETEKSKDNPSDAVAALPGSKDRDMGYVRYVHQIFQQHQEDSHLPKVGDRFIDHFEKARWDDAAIMEAPDDKLTAYEYAVKTIAQRIKTGRMDAIALIELVGDKQKKIVHSDGRSFGPRGAGKDDEAIKKAILKVIDEKTVTLHAGQKQTEEQINEKLGDFVFSVDDLKRALESKAMDRQQQAFIFTLFSNVVGSDDKLCARLGISKERCQELRRESRESVNSMLTGAVRVLAEIIKNEPETLEKQAKFKLTDRQKALILSLAERIEQQGRNVADTANNSEEVKSLETIVANASMTLGAQGALGGEDGRPGFWRRLVTTARQKLEPVTRARATGKGADDYEEENKAYRDAYAGMENAGDKSGWAEREISRGREPARDDQGEDDHKPGRGFAGRIPHKGMDGYAGSSLSASPQGMFPKG